MKKHLLVVDDEKSLQHVLKLALEKAGYHISVADNGEEAWEKLLNEKIDLILSDLKMPKCDGVGLLKKIQEAKMSVPFILMTAHGTIESAVEAMKSGANDYVIKPFDNDELELLIQRIFETERLKKENALLKSALEEDNIDNIIGYSPQMQQVLKIVKSAAPTPSNVLITGETGTGKEVLARFVHKESQRDAETFVAINCSAIPENLLESELFGYTKGAFTGADRDKVGKVELAHNGTLFLDEIGDMTLALQSKLLRVLETKTFERLGSTQSMHSDFRLIAATNRDLETMVKQKEFRSDLFYRLNVISIQLPPLRMRREDIPHFASFFLDKYALQMGKDIQRMSSDVLAYLYQYNWPGNIRELENVIERAVVLCQTQEITADLLPQDIRQGGTQSGEGAEASGAANFEQAILAKEKELIEEALSKSEGIKSKAARLLGMSERNLWYKLKKHKIDT